MIAAFILYQEKHTSISLAIVAGGGQGVIFNLSIGAEYDMVAIVQKIIEQME